MSLYSCSCKTPWHKHDFGCFGPVFTWRSSNRFFVVRISRSGNGDGLCRVSRTYGKTKATHGTPCEHCVYLWQVEPFRAVDACSTFKPVNCARPRYSTWRSFAFTQLIICIYLSSSIIVHGCAIWVTFNQYLLILHFTFREVQLLLITCLYFCNDMNISRDKSFKTDSTYLNFRITIN